MMFKLTRNAPPQQYLCPTRPLADSFSRLIRVEGENMKLDGAVTGLQKEKHELDAKLKRM
jgi:hypothetical protein